MVKKHFQFKVLATAVAVLFISGAINWVNAEDASAFIEIKNKSPLEMFQDASYLYELGDYQGALILYNKIRDQAEDELLKRKAQLGKDLVESLLKAERLGPQQAPKEYRRAEKLEMRKNRMSIARLYKEGRLALQAKQFNRAMGLFRQILILDPNQKIARAYVKKIPEVVKEKKLTWLYAQADLALKNKDYAKSQGFFKRILQIDPEQSQAKAYLQNKLPVLIKQQAIAKLYPQAEEALFQKEDLGLAANLYKQILALDPQQQKAKAYLEKDIPLKAQILTMRQVNALYQQALAGLKEKNYTQAQEFFKQILAINPQQNLAQEYLNQTQAISQKRKIANLYAEAHAAFSRKDYDQAAKSFAEITNLNASQSEAKQYIETRIPAAIKADQVALLHTQAMAAFKGQDYKTASQRFNEVLALEPNHAEAKKYAAILIPEKLVAQAKAAQETEKRFNLAREQQMRLALEESQKKHPRELSPQKKYADVIKYLYSLGIKSYQQGNLATAGYYFDKILKLDPTQPLARTYLEKIGR